MLIKSSFKDFYDYCLSDIVIPDTDIVYPRNLTLTEIKRKAVAIDIKEQKREISVFFVILNKKIYSGIQEQIFEIEQFQFYDKKKIVKTSYFYNIDEVEIDEKYKSIITNIINKTISEFNPEEFSLFPIYIDKYSTKVQVVSPSIKNDFFSFSKKVNESQAKRKEEVKKIVLSEEYNTLPFVVANDSLKEVSFNKKMDPKLVYQEIESFLIKKADISKEVSFTDTQKIQQHGFDKKSFRRKK